MVTAHHSRVDSMFIAPGSSCRKSPVHHAWQDVKAAERDPIMRVRPIHSIGEDRRPAPGAVAGLRARASQAMMMNRSPVKELENKQTDFHGLAHGSIRSANVTAHFMESLHGYSLRIHPAASSQPAKFQNRPLSGLVSSAIPSQRSTSPQRPHTAPATERKFRRSAGAMQQKPHLDTASAVPATADLLSSDSPGRQLVSRAQPSGIPLRTHVLSGSAHAPALGPTWQRRIRGVTAPADVIERRAGRSRSTEPLLLRKSSGMATSWSGEASITDVIARSPGRPRMKAPVDCWWEERQSSKAPPAKSRNVFNNLGKGQGPRLRSSSAGRRKQRTSSYCIPEPAAAEPLQAGSNQRDSREEMRLASPQTPTRNRSASQGHEASSSRHRRSGSSHSGSTCPQVMSSPQACISRKPQRHEFGVQPSEVSLKGGAESYCSKLAHQIGAASLQGIRATGGVGSSDEVRRVDRCASTISDDTDAALLELARLLPQQITGVVLSPRRFGDSQQFVSTQEFGLMTGHGTCTGIPEGFPGTGLDSLTDAISRHDRNSSCLPGLGKRVSVIPCEWDEMCLEQGELGKLQCSLHSLANDLGISNCWCCSLCEELLEHGMASESEDDQ